MAEAHHIGLLSQTLSPSPTIRWILPARIRTKSKNDVVFVGQSFVQLREFMSNGLLADVTARVDLSAQILAAKVVSAKREYLQIMDQIIHQMRDVEKFTIGDDEIGDDQPAQLIVLSIASNEIIFLFAEDVGPGKTRFVYAKKRIIRDVSLSERYGAHIAVDPESRAIAVAPSLGYCGIFGLKEIDEIQAEILQSELDPYHTFKPTNQDHILAIDGLILKMDFLESGDSDPNKLLLLLLVVRGGHTFLLLYRWDVRRGPKYAQPLPCSGQRLEQEDSLPLMLIPSTRNGTASFYIVTETHLVVFDNVTCGEARRKAHLLKQELPPTFESSSIPPLYVHWAKAIRHKRYVETNDDFYLVREDGQLHYFIVTHNSLHRIEADFAAGNFKTSVDTAFAILRGPVELGGDVHLVGGDMTDGGVYHCCARSEPKPVQTFPNLAPMRDLLITQPHERFDGQSPDHSQNRHRIFTCSGKESRYSFVNEIRFGLEAQIGWQIPYPDSSSATRIWILEDRTPGRVLFLMSHPVQSTVISLHQSSLQNDPEVYNLNSHPGLDLEVPTLAAACTPQGIMIQITRRSTNISDVFSDIEPTCTPHNKVVCVAATIHSKSGHFVLACKTTQGFELKLGAVGTNGPRPEVIFGRGFGMTLEPTSLSLCKIGQRVLLLVGTSDGSLELYCTGAEGDLQHFRSYRIQHLVPDIEVSPISSLGVLSRSDAWEALVLCGLRTGSVVILAVKSLSNSNSSDLNITFMSKSNLGSTTVTVIEEQQTTSCFHAVLLLCGSDIRRLSLLDDFGFEYSISPIWLTDFKKPSISQPVINAACRSVNNTVANIDGLLICATEKELLVSSLILQDQAVPRRFKLSGPPVRLSYSKYLKRLVVALNSIELLPTASGPILTIHRSVLPSLELVNPDELVNYDDLVNPEEQENHDERKTLEPVKNRDDILVIGGDGDRIRAILNWRPTDGSAHYELILVGLDSDAPDNTSSSGRLVYANAGNVGKLPFRKIRVHTISKFSGRPVFSLQAYGISSLLVGAGNDIILQSFDMSTRKFSEVSTFALPSAATSLSVSRNLVYASSMNHSLLVLEILGNTIKLRAADTVAKNTRNAVIVEGQFTMISTVSAGGTTLVAFSQALADRLPQTEILFEARIPLILEGIKQNYKDSTDGEARKTFEAITLDGTLYRFKTLSYQEWQLLKFLENCLRKGSYTQEMRALRRARPEPYEMHVRGDLLALLAEPGPHSLRKVLLRGSNIHGKDSPNKTEEAKQRGAQFRKLAATVIGDLDDPIAGVIFWLRDLMRIA